MKITPIKYRFNSNDYDTLVNLGYRFVNLNGKDFISLMNERFKNLDLVKLLDVVEKKFVPTSSSPVGRHIEFNHSEGFLRFSISNSFTSEDDALALVRTIRNYEKAIEVKHDFCVIPVSHRGNRLAQELFRESLQQYVNLGVSKIKVEAGLSGGGYVWARHGFVACNRREVDEILQLAKRTLTKKQFKITQVIFDGYYNKNPTGEMFPIDLWAELPFMKDVLMGSHWHGELNLKNKEQLDNFISYVYR